MKILTVTNTIDYIDENIGFPIRSGEKLDRILSEISACMRKTYWSSNDLRNLEIKLLTETRKVKLQLRIKEIFQNLNRKRSGKDTDPILKEMISQKLQEEKRVREALKRKIILTKVCFNEYEKDPIHRK